MIQRVPFAPKNSTTRLVRNDGLDLILKASATSRGKAYRNSAVLCIYLCYALESEKKLLSLKLSSPVGIWLPGKSGMQITENRRVF